MTGGGGGEVDCMLRVRVRVYGGTPAEAADAVRNFRGTFGIRADGEVEILDAEVIPPRPRAADWVRYWAHRMAGHLVWDASLYTGQFSCSTCDLTWGPRLR